MIKVIFYLKASKTAKSGESPIFARITVPGQSITISTGRTISKERWRQTDNLRATLRLEKEKIIKSALDRFKIDIENKYSLLSQTGNYISIDLLKSSVQGKPAPKTKSAGMIAIMEKHNTNFKKKSDAGDRAYTSLQKYERAKTLLSTFLLKQYKMEEMEASQVDGAFIYELETYLRYDSTFKGTVGIKNNSVVKYMRMFKTACRHAVRVGIIDKNPFDAYDGKLKVTDAIFLTQLELDAIESKSFGVQRLEKVKDIFLFSCYTGYAPVDASNLNSTNIVKDGSGSLWLMARRAKTEIRANVPVLAPALKIIKKYSGQQAGLLPSISNQKMNAYLKEIGDLCGIAKKLTWYVARHTFATTVTLGNGVRIENVSAMMGHTNIKQTQHYAKVMDENVMLDMERLKERYK